MQCLVLGGGGFIGSAIVDRLLRAGYPVRVFERPRVAPFRSFEAHSFAGNNLQHAVAVLGADRLSSNPAKSGKDRS